MPMTLLHRNLVGRCIYCDKAQTDQQPDEPCDGPTGELEMSETEVMESLVIYSDLHAQIDLFKPIFRDNMRLRRQLKNQSR